MLPGLRNYTTLVGSGGSLCAGTWASRTRFALFPFGVASRRQQHQPVRLFFRYASAGRHLSGPETRARHPLGGKQKQTKKPWILINVIWILNFLFSFFADRRFIAFALTERIESEPKPVSAELTSVKILPKMGRTLRLPDVPVLRAPFAARECTDQLRNWIST